MVEPITAQTLQKNIEQLLENRLLDPALGKELDSLLAGADTLSNWTDTSQFLKREGFSRIQASGPVSKVLRTLTFLLERIADSSAEWSTGEPVTISHITLSNTSSGCSDFRGHIQAVIRDESSGKEALLVQGKFVWDCSAQGLPQPQAARDLGYRCMVTFPEIALEQMISKP